jgi:hypothetical protein
MLSFEVTNMVNEDKDVSYMHDYFPASLKEESVNRIQQLEQEISSELGGKVIIMAFTPKGESWGDY